MSIKSLVIVPLVILAVPVVSGCGGDDNKGDSGEAAAPAATETQPATQEAGSTLTVRMTEFAFDPKNAVAKAGKVTISAPNEGKVVHELVVLKTNADPARLPMDGDEVDESTNVGEIPDVEPGATKKVTLKLAAGKYAMICALPGHYQGGMYGSLTVR